MVLTATVLIALAFGLSVLFTVAPLLAVTFAIVVGFAGGLWTGWHV